MGEFPADIRACIVYATVGWLVFWTLKEETISVDKLYSPAAVVKQLVCILFCPQSVMPEYAQPIFHGKPHF